MPLIVINADLTRACDLLERIAIAAERAAGPVAKEHKPRATQPHDIGRVALGAESVAMQKIKQAGRLFGGQP